MADASPVVLAVAGSMRAGSYNRKLLRVAVRTTEEAGADVDLVDLRELGLPLYDGDIEEKYGLPASVAAFKERIARARGLLIASPEYNSSVPGTFKNAIDWASRPPGNVFKDKIAALMGASPGGFGAVRSLIHLRQVLTTLGVWLVPVQVTVARAHEAFDASGALKDPKINQQISELTQQLVNHLR
jgi:chromate reductase